MIKITPLYHSARESPSQTVPLIESITGTPRLPLVISPFNVNTFDATLPSTLPLKVNASRWQGDVILVPLETKLDVDSLLKD